jgi:nucleotide-binding universal stress UspA family protein
MIFRHILVAVDFGSSSQAALDRAIELAAKLDTKLTLVHVCEVTPMIYAGMEYPVADWLTPLQDAAKKELDDLAAKVKAKVPGVGTALRVGFAAEEILAVAASTGADLVVTGTHGRKGIGRFLLGSVAERVVRLSKVPVLTVREHG